MRGLHLHVIYCVCWQVSLHEHNMHNMAARESQCTL